MEKVIMTLDELNDKFDKLQKQIEMLAKDVKELFDMMRELQRDIYNTCNKR